MEDELFYGAAYKGQAAYQGQDISADYEETRDGTEHTIEEEEVNAGIDLNEQLVMNRPATFFFRMNSDSMEEAGIQPGDVLIVDRSIAVTNGKIIIAVVDGELLIRRYRSGFHKQSLCAENRRYNNIDIHEFTNFNPWGVVTSVIHLIDPALIAHSKTRKLQDNQC